MANNTYAQLQNLVGQLQQKRIDDNLGAPILYDANNATDYGREYSGLSDSDLTTNYDRTHFYNIPGQPGYLINQGGVDASGRPVLDKGFKYRPGYKLNGGDRPVSIQYNPDGTIVQGSEDPMENGWMDKHGEQLVKLGIAIMGGGALAGAFAGAGAAGGAAGAGATEGAAAGVGTGAFDMGGIAGGVEGAGGATGLGTSFGLGDASLGGTLAGTGYDAALDLPGGLDVGDGGLNGINDLSQFSGANGLESVPSSSLPNGSSPQGATPSSTNGPLSNLAKNILTNPKNLSTAVGLINSLSGSHGASGSGGGASQTGANDKWTPYQQANADKFFNSPRATQVNPYVGDVSRAPIVGGEHQWFTQDKQTPKWDSQGAIKDYVDHNLYGGMLGRQPDQEGSNYWTSETSKNGWDANRLRDEVQKSANIVNSGNGGIASLYSPGFMGGAQSSNQMPAGTPLTTLAQNNPDVRHFANGGEVSGYGNGALSAIQGNGSGQDDVVPAMLAPGEHILDADLVSAIGNGSTEAGHRAIEEFKKAIRHHKRSANANNIPPMTGNLMQYLRG